MEIRHTVLWHEKVRSQDFPKLSTTIKKRIRGAVEEKLTINPLLFGKPLRLSLAGYRSLRVGDWRIVFRIEKQTVKIFLVAHRSVVYEEMFSRA